MMKFYDLPIASDAALKRSHALHAEIKNEIIEQKGVIPFSTFMELALYHPTLGYYNAETITIGEAGDFTTASLISSLYAECFAEQVIQIFEHLNSNFILELGAGTGHFAHDILVALSKKNYLPEKYFIYETSRTLCHKQKALLQTQIPELAARVIWLDALPTNFKGIVIANEVLDALPVDCFKVEAHRIREKCVSYEDGEFTWKACEPLTQDFAMKVQDIAKRYNLSNGYESEVNLVLATFIKQLVKNLDQGYLLIADYGYGQAEYYRNERNQGTLTCFYHHRKHHDPLILPGLQDITTHVDFTTVAENALDAGCTLAGYTTQAAFLLACGLINLATLEETKLSPAEIVTLHQNIKLLTLPTEMGERIKIMALAKNMNIPLKGFKLQDRRQDL